MSAPGEELCCLLSPRRGFLDVYCTTKRRFNVLLMKLNSCEKFSIVSSEQGSLE